MTRILIPALALLPVAAMAHPGDHRATGLWHALTEPDHLAFLAVVAAGVGYAVFTLWPRA